MPLAGTLRKSDEKDEINGKESQQVGVYHLVDHHDERSNDAKSSEQFSTQSATMNCSNYVLCSLTE